MKRPMFHRRHYQAIAKVIQAKNCLYGRQPVLDALCELFAKDNPAFNEEKFLDARYWDDVDYTTDRRGM